MSSSKTNKLALFLLIGLILPIYSNSFYSSWHFDDYHSIIKNGNIHINDLSISELKKSLYASTDAGAYAGKKLYRPVSTITFALNWYFGTNKVLGYHIVNMTIHTVTAFFLFLTMQQLLTSPKLSPFHLKHACSLALLSAAFWAINPIHTQAVTYIVQRMASLAAMFYILSIYLYCRARLTNRLKQRILFFATSAITALLAIGSKENAVMLPASLFLVEIVFFQQISTKKQQFHFKRIACFGVISALVFISFLYFNGTITSIINGYQTRPFTLGQRLLTEGRIVILYISQLFYPDADRLSLSHDIEISTSFFDPWTTAPSLIIIGMLIILAVIRLNKNPIISFAILFFFLNHIIESSIIPLELIFEHRNYLPSAFIFMPLALGVMRLFDHYHYKKMMKACIFSFTAFLLIIFGFNTYLRNMAWQTEFSLWNDAARKAPNNSRAIAGLARAYNQKNYSERALYLYKNSLQGRMERTKEHFAPQIHRNIAITYIKQKKYNEAEKHCLEALEINPDYERARYLLCEIYLHLKQPSKADESADILLEEDNNNFKYHTRKGLTSIRVRNYGRAMQAFQKALDLNNHDNEAKIGLGIASSKIGKHKSAERFLLDAQTYAKKDIRIYLALIENQQMADPGIIKHDYLLSLLDSFPLTTIITSISQLSNNAAGIYLPEENLYQIIKTYVSHEFRL